MQLIKMLFALGATAKVTVPIKNKRYVVCQASQWPVVGSGVDGWVFAIEIRDLKKIFHEIVFTRKNTSLSPFSPPFLFPFLSDWHMTRH